MSFVSFLYYNQIENWYLPLPFPWIGLIIWLVNSKLINLDAIAGFILIISIISERPKYWVLLYLSYSFNICCSDFAEILDILHLHTFSMSTFVQSMSTFVSSMSTFISSMFIYYWAVSSKSFSSEPSPIMYII